jgi:hypothetical protein
MHVDILQKAGKGATLDWTHCPQAGCWIIPWFTHTHPLILGVKVAYIHHRGDGWRTQLLGCKSLPRAEGCCCCWAYAAATQAIQWQKLLKWAITITLDSGCPELMEVPELECQEKMTTAERHKEKWSPRQQLLFDFGQFVLMGMNHHHSNPLSEGACAITTFCWICWTGQVRSMFLNFCSPFPHSPVLLALPTKARICV